MTSSDSVQIRISENPEQHRFEAFVDESLAGWTVYEVHGSRYAFVHTEIHDGYEGHGVGTALIRAALDEMRDRGAAVLPFCPFVLAFIEHHLDPYLDLVPEDARARFHLPQVTT